mgnify:CR=1 FL=1
MIEARVFFYVFVCIAFDIEIAQLGILGLHALKYVIGGPRVENHTPLSLKHDEEGGGANIALKCIAMSCLSFVAANQSSAGRNG